MWELDCFNARDYREDPAYLALFPRRAPLANGTDTDDADDDSETER